MARKSTPTILQEELYAPPVEAVRADLDDARLLDLDAEQESPFLRAQKRVSARRGSLPKKTAIRLLWAAIAATIFLICGVASAALYRYGEHSWRFRVESSDNIEIAGLQNVNHSQIMEVMGGDIGRNIFFIPLAQRKVQLEQIPWVESASVMRFVPNRLRIEIHERVPVAFARIGSRIQLVDAGGTLMELTGRKKYSFPVIVGMNAGEPASTRAARMKIYNDLIRQLDSGGAHYAQDLSEVDLSDPDDVKVIANDSRGEVLVHLGSENYLERYKIYVGHVQEWRQQFDKVESVDLRYDRQIIVNPDLGGAPRQAPLSTNAARAAMSAGVKPAALATHKFIGPRNAQETQLASAQARPHISDRRSSAERITDMPVRHKPAAARRPVPSRKSATNAKRTVKHKPTARTVHATTPQPVVKPAATKSTVVAATHPVKSGKPSPSIAKEQNTP